MGGLDDEDRGRNHAPASRQRLTARSLLTLTPSYEVIDEKITRRRTQRPGSLVALVQDHS